jgi:hypothetical protein
VVFAVAASLYGLHVSALTIPGIGKAALIGIWLSPLILLVAGLITAAAVTRTAPGASRPRPDTWRRTLPLAAGSAVVGTLIGAATWYYVDPHWTAVPFGIVGTILVAVAGRYAHQTGRSQDLRRSAVAGLAVAIMVAIVVSVPHAVINHDNVKWLAWPRTWVLLAGLPAATVSARRSGRSGRPAVGVQWRARKGVLGALAGAAAAALVGGFVSRAAFGLPLSLLGISIAVAGGAVFGIERVPGDAAEAAGPSTVLAHDRHAALLITLVTGAIAAVLTGVAVDSWDTSYHFPDPGPVIATEDALSMAAGVGIAIAAGLAVTGLGLVWPQWLIARSWLALRGQLPLRLMSFLNDAHQRGVLRHAGPYYQFRHIELQHHLAARYQARRPPNNRPGKLG